jgi:hypothetical protein
MFEEHGRVDAGAELRMERDFPDPGPLAVMHRTLSPEIGTSPVSRPTSP